MPDVEEPTPNQENDAATDATATPDQRPRTSISSFFLMTFILFMLTSNSGEDILVKNLYIESLKSLQYQQSNYSAWRNAFTTNFSMPGRDYSQISLVQSLMSFGNPLDAEYASYYENITGFVRGPIDFYNLSSYHNASSTRLTTESNQIPIFNWDILAEQYVSTSNISDLTERAATWNWTACDKIEMRIMEKKPVLSNIEADNNVTYTTNDISLLHGRLELSDVNTGEELDFDLEAVHFLRNGSIFGFAEPAGPHVDIRLLPSLVPESRMNDTARAVDTMLLSQITHLREIIDSGTVVLESTADQARITTCTFALYAQIIPSDLPGFYMQELETELEQPTGITTAAQPPLKLNGVLVSKNCALLYVINEAEGLKSQRFWQKVTTYSGVAAIVNLVLLFLLSRQTKTISTPAGLSRLSRWTFFTQAAADSISFIGHVTFGVVADGRPSISLVAPAFLSCMLLVSEAHFGLSIQQIQAPEAVNAARPIPIPTTAPVTEGQQQTPADTTPPTTAPQVPNNPVTRLSEFFLQTWQRVWSNPQARFWFTILLVLSIFVRIVVSPSLVLLLIASIYSMFWLPSIIRSARRGNSSGLSKEYLIGTTVCRSYFALYLFACPNNVLGVDTTRWIFVVVGFVFLQVLTIFLQDYFGAAFFLPRGYAEVPTYDYHPVMSVVDSEAPEQSLGDCSICMEPIIINQDHRRRSLSEKSRRSGDKEKSGGLFGAMQLGIEVAGRGAGVSKKNWAVAPCHHIFHTACLERWLSIKNICPQCRRPLPPL